MLSQLNCQGIFNESLEDKFEMPSLPDNDQSCNPQLASLVAINIVTHVLNEAQDIVNKANYSGQSWRYVWRQKKRNSELYENVDLSGITDSKCDESDIHHNNVIITSTPQKQIKSDVITKDYNESGLIGQGDEDVQTRNIDVRSPSIIIDCLFDSNDLDQAESFDDDEDVQNDLERDELLTNSVTAFVESYINLAVNAACDNVFKSKLATNANSIGDSTSSSSYSLLDDACGSNVDGNVTFNLEEVKCEENRNVCDTRLTEVMVDNDDTEEIKKKDIDLYEKTFSTLNRDYDKCSEEDFPEDQMSVPMQEVELPTNLLSSESLAFRPKLDQDLSLTTPRDNETVTKSTKNNLLKRCRFHGSRFISRLRSWLWKQRLIGRRRGSRTSLPGMCPLSPKARNRTASFLGHCKLRTPSPTRMCAWKFNTINEAIIHAYNKKEFEMENKATAPVDK